MTIVGPTILVVTGCILPDPNGYSTFTELMVNALVPPGTLKVKKGLIKSAASALFTSISTVNGEHIVTGVIVVFNTSICTSEFLGSK